MIEARNKPPRRDERRKARDQKRWPTKEKAHHPGKMAGLKMNSQEQSAKANSKTKPMIAPVLACHNHRKPRGPVCEDTLRQAFAAHDETVGFVAPKFHNRLQLQAVDRYRNAGGGVVLGKMGHSVRMAAWLVSCLQHLAHPLHVKVQRVVPKVRQGTKTMMQAASVRTSAHPTPSAYTPTAHHAGNFNRDVIAIANIENALQRVMYELKKASPDMARAQKLTLAAMAAVQYVGYEVLQ